MTDFRKLNARGGQWNPFAPIEGVTPILEPLPYEERKRLHYEAVAAFNDVQAGRSVDWLFEAYDIDPDPGDILKPMIQASQEQHDCTWAQAQQQLVGMDGVFSVGQRLHDWAKEQLASGDAEIAKRYRLTDDGINDDIVAREFWLPGFITEGLWKTECVVFAEKRAQEEALAALDEHEGYGFRPETVIAAQSGVDCAVSTAYVAGAPAMGNNPQGHSSFWAFMFERVAMALTGRGIDKVCDHSALHGGIYRVLANVHTMDTVFTGNDIGKRGAHGEFDDLVIP